MRNIYTYGIEADQNIAKQACNNVDKIAIGGFSGSRITNNAFDIVYANPLIAWETTFMNNQNPYTLKKEKVFLNNILKYIRVNGILILTIPYFRLYKDIVFILAKNFKHIQIRRSSLFNSYGVVTIIAQRKENNKEVDADIYRELRKYHTQNIISLNEFDHYNLPDQAIEIDTFRGSILSSEQLSKIITTSGCMDSFWKKQSVEKLSESKKQPLLPFNIGQIGLVLTSGCLDGVIDEGNGNYHLIKGRVTKQSSIENNYEENQLETQETISNRVEINVLLPNGDFKVLA